MIQIDPIRGLVWDGYGYGKVVDGKTVHDQLKVYWVGCPKCGKPQPPHTVYLWRRDQWVLDIVGDAREGIGACSWCGTPAPIRQAIIPATSSGHHEKCTNRCLNGKAMCRCGCLGRCHGEGKCYCKRKEEPCLKSSES